MTQITFEDVFSNIMCEILSEWITLDVVLQLLTAVCNQGRINAIFTIVSQTIGFSVQEKIDDKHKFTCRPSRNYFFERMTNNFLFQLVKRKIKIRNLNIDGNFYLLSILDVSHVQLFRLFGTHYNEYSESDLKWVVLRLKEMTNLKVLFLNFRPKYVFLRAAVESIRFKIWKNLLVFAGPADLCTLYCVSNHCRGLEKLYWEQPVEHANNLQQSETYSETLLQTMRKIATTNKNLSSLALDNIPLTEGLLKVMWTEFGSLVKFSAYQCCHSLSLGEVLQFCPSGILEVVIRYVFESQYNSFHGRRYQNINWDLDMKTLTMSVGPFFDDKQLVSGCCILPSTMNVLTLDRLPLTCDDIRSILESSSSNVTHLILINCVFVKHVDAVELQLYMQNTYKREITIKMYPKVFTESDEEFAEYLSHYCNEYEPGERQLQQQVKQRKRKTPRTKKIKK